MRAHLCVLGSTLVLSGCANPYALVSHVHPHLTGAPGVGSLAAAEQAMTKAMHEKRSKALIALADCLRDFHLVLLLQETLDLPYCHRLGIMAIIS